MNLMQNIDILKTMKLVGYVRVSTEQQIEKYGIPMQKERITKHCRSLGLTMDRIFMDAGKSGAMKDDEDEPRNRQGFLELLAYVEEDPAVTGVIVVDTKRLWRNENARVWVCRELRKRKIDVYSIDESEFTLFPDSPIRTFTTKVIAAIAELDRDTINKRLADGRGTKARTTGTKPAGNTPFGYMYSSDKKSLCVNAWEAVIVREMFRRREEGSGLSDIVKAFAEKGYRNRSNKPFSKQAISYMLKNPFYCGILTHAGEQIRGSHEPLISKSAWKALNPDIVIEV